jgi:hypothetical protein
VRDDKGKKRRQGGRKLWKFIVCMYEKVIVKPILKYCKIKKEKRKNKE